MALPALDLWTAVAFAVLFALTFALARRRPIYGALALFATLPFDAPHWVWATSLSVPKVVLLGAGAAALARALDPTVLRRAPVNGLVLAAGAMLAATLLSALTADDRGEVLRQSFKAAEYLAALILGAASFANDPDETPVRAVAAVAAIVVGGLAFLELLPGAAVSVAPAGAVLIPRLAGPLEGPNQLAGYLSLLLPIPFAFAVRGRARPLERAALVVAAATLVLTLSRAGLLSTLAALAIVVLLGPEPGMQRGSRRGPVGLVALGFGLGVGALLLALGLRAGGAVGESALLARLSLDEPARTGGVGHRSDLWRAALVLWRRHPLLGVGAGNFERELDRAGLHGVRTHANSLYLQALVEGGVPLLAATLAWVWAATVPLFARVRTASPLVLGVAAGSAALVLHQIVDLMLFYPKVGEAWCLLLGIAGAAAAREPRTARAASTAAAPA